MELSTTKKTLFTFGVGAFGKMSNLIKNTDYLPQKPSYLFKLLKMAYSVNVASSDMAKELIADKETVARVLNIPSLQNNYEKIDQEDVMNTLANLEKNFIQSSLEINCAKKFQKAFLEIADPNLKNKWRASVKAAIIAKAIAKWTNYEEVEMAFFASLLSEVPQLVLSINDPEARAKVEEKVEKGMSEKEAEIVVNGFDHTEFGAKLFKYYSMPNSLVELVQHDFRPDKVKAKHVELAKIVNFSKFLAKCFSDKSQSPSSIWTESQESLKDLGLSISPEEWGNKISLMFVKSIEFEMSVIN